MAALIPFNPSPSANFQFQVTLDGSPYNVVCTYNPYAQRYYVSIYDLTQTLVLSRPLIESPDDYSVSLTLGYFDTALVFHEPAQAFEVI